MQIEDFRRVEENGDGEVVGLIVCTDPEVEKKKTLAAIMPNGIHDPCSWLCTFGWQEV
jgi:hypothetical protein